MRWPTTSSGSRSVKRLQYGDKVKSIEVVDPYTVRLHLTEYNNMLIHGLGWVFMWSKPALTTKSPDWLRANPVGTGPFKLAEWRRDDHIKWERNKDYWQKGRPYLDGIEIRYVPDPVTASEMMQTKQADMWTNAPVKDQADLEKKGFVRNFGYAGLPPTIFFNTTDPNKPTGKLKVREAIEYALDKAAMAKALGFGYAVTPEDDGARRRVGIRPGYKGRTYDPQKAKQLLSEAGYPNGLKLKLMILQGQQGSCNGDKVLYGSGGLQRRHRHRRPAGSSAAWFGPTGFDRHAPRLHRPRPDLPGHLPALVRP